MTTTRTGIATTTETDGTTTATMAVVDATSGLPPRGSTFSGAGLVPRSVVMMRGTEIAEKTAETTAAVMAAVATRP